MMFFAYFNHISILCPKGQYIKTQLLNIYINSKKLYKSSMHKSKHNLERDNVKVVVRVRPPLTRELEGDLFISNTQVMEDQKSIQLIQYYNLEGLSQDNVQTYLEDCRNYNRHEYMFDHVYDDEASQEEVYKNTARLSVCSALEGYNATIFAYGQTGTGKTYTMEGFKYSLTDQSRGIIPRAIEDIFRFIEGCEDEEVTFMVRASYIQIYNEVVSDLLRTEKKQLNIREDPKRGVYVQGVSEWAVVRPQQILELMKMGTKSRAIAKTNMNESSSRSHAVFIITIEQMKENENETEGKEIKVAKLNLVDLAGSERVRVTGASGKRLDECKNINLSLSCLGMVIGALTENKPHVHIPYRNSVLTRLLSDSLGGNCKTTMLTMISPAPEAFLESLSSLKFAHRAKSIKNKPSINQDLDQKALIRKYQNELNKLRSELDQKNKVLIDKTKLLQLEEEKKKIEEDKNKVVEALNRKSHEFFKEREEKKILEQKIKAFNSQLIHTGKDSLEKMLEDQKSIIIQYENKIRSLESERGKSADETLSSQLFEKQNMILMNLAAKLNQRDQVNMHLNEELYAYDRITKETEEALQRKTLRIQQLEKILRKNKIAVPEEEFDCSAKKREDQRIDGVYLQGELTYNITEKNLAKTEKEMAVLREVNGQQKEEIVRLKEQLLKKDTCKSVVSEEKGMKGYKSIGDSISFIMKGLQSKENADMKSIIAQIYKIRRVVEQHVN